MNDIFEIIKSRRTIRKFDKKCVEYDSLLTLIEAARLAPTGANLQSLKYVIVTDKEVREKLYPHIKYAGYIPGWDPSFEESPKAFIAILNDTSIKPTEKAECDSGAAVMSMCLAAKELGLDTCWLGAINRAEIKNIIETDDSLDIMYLLGIGYAAQTGSFYDCDDNVKYSFDESGNVSVPKRSINEILIKSI